MAQAAPDWLRLQRKIFSRWVNHQLKAADPQLGCADVVSNMDGKLLIRLVERLSDKKYADSKGILKKEAKMRPQKIDVAKAALDFVFEQNVKLQLKPNAEDIVDGDEKNILALIWALMLRFVKFGDEGDDEGGQAALNAKDSLLLWCSNKIGSYKLDDIATFKGKSWKNGQALCALIHKHRPKLINWDDVKKSNDHDNIARAFNAAHAYFDLEKYLEVTDLAKLDESSMVVYVSEYYYGIAEQRKIDLAGRRISKLVAYTIKNDQLRADYVKTAQSFVQTLQQVGQKLGDRSVDNTLAGAKRKIEEFYEYKSGDKSKLIGNQLSLESLYNELATRLSQQKRPPFKPQPGTSLQDVQKAMQKLETDEQERSVALHAELNRQLKLVKWNEQHQARFDKLSTWIQAKEQYLNTTENSNSVSEATLALATLDAFDKESSAVQGNAGKVLKELGASLAKEKYEHSGKVQEREKAVDNHFVQLGHLSKEKRKVLEQDLQREKERERLRLEWAHHSSVYVDWLADAATNTVFTHFGFTLKEVQDFKATLDNIDKDLNKHADSLKAQCDHIWKDLNNLGVNESDLRYSENTPASLQNARNQFSGSLNERHQHYATELARQVANDKLCQEFAGVVDPFSQWLVQQKQTVSNATGTLESQLEFVHARVSHGAAESAPVNTARGIDGKIQAAGITNNIHTTLSFKDIELQLQQYQEFLKIKSKMLAEEIEKAKLRGLTPEQLKEIDDNFCQFDTDGDGSISKKELKACLYSLGEEKTNSEVDDILAKNGTGGRIPQNNFKEFMIGVLGDSETKESILLGFKLINRGSETAIHEKMVMVLPEEDVKYIESNSQNGNYKGWTEDVFAR